MKKQENRKEFERLSKPLIEWLNENWNPHTKIIIDTTSAEVVSGEMSVVTTEFVKD